MSSRMCFVALSMALVACAPKAQPYGGSRGSLDRQFKVSVESGGQEIRDFEKSLVHRVVLSSAQVSSALSDWPQSIQLPLVTRPELDSAGGLKGFRVMNKLSTPGLSDLGLERGDVITGVGKRPIAELRELGVVFESVRENKLISITFEREGKPHKSFYFSR